MNFVILQWIADDPHGNQRTMSCIFNPVVKGQATMAPSSPGPGSFAECQDCWSLYSLLSHCWLLQHRRTNCDMTASHLRLGLHCWFLINRMLKFPLYLYANNFILRQETSFSPWIFGYIFILLSLFSLLIPWIPIKTALEDIRNFFLNLILL